MSFRCEHSLVGNILVCMSSKNYVCRVEHQLLVDRYYIMLRWQIVRFLFLFEHFNSHCICHELCWMKQDCLSFSMIGNIPNVHFVISCLKNNKRKCQLYCVCLLFLTLIIKCKAMYFIIQDTGFWTPLGFLHKDYRDCIERKAENPCELYGIN